MVVSLTGFMASGKSCFGRAAAQILGWNFEDLDALISETYDTPAEIIRCHGEDFFRKIESEMLVSALRQERDTILALGGGTVLRQINVRRLKEMSHVIWLNTSIDIIMSELSNSDRPLVHNMTRGQIEAFYESRKPFYRAVADTTVDIVSTDYSIAVNDIVDACIGFL